MKYQNAVYPALFLAGVGAPLMAQAHCPLCTAGAGAAAVLAAWLGVSSTSIGIFIGAFAAALGLWMARVLKKRGIRIPAAATFVVTFLLTIVPLLPLFRDYTSVYISMAGDYGSPLNRTYLINLFLLGSAIGAGLLLVSPAISKRLSAIRSKPLFPYQGVAVTLLLLLLTSLTIEFTL